MSEPLQLDPTLFWRYRAAAAERLTAQQRLTLSQHLLQRDVDLAQQRFLAVQSEITQAYASFDINGTYRADDATCQLVPVEDRRVESPDESAS